MKFPKGASAAVDAAAKEFITRHGAENLPKVAKMHFRTAFRAQGLPEPPKREWRKKSKTASLGASRLSQSSCKKIGQCRPLGALVFFCSSLGRKVENR